VFLPQTPQLPPTPAEIEMEVRENVLNQPLGDGTVADLALPEEFLSRVADRIVRSSFEERYRIVVKGVEPRNRSPEPPGLAAGKSVVIILVAAVVALLAVVWAAIARWRRARG
jgi:hypothetical protein